MLTDERFNSLNWEDARSADLVGFTVSEVENVRTDFAYDKGDGIYSSVILHGQDKAGQQVIFEIGYDFYDDGYKGMIITKAVIGENWGEGIE